MYGDTILFFLFFVDLSDFHMSKIASVNHDELVEKSNDD